jgi:hypothetical protein
MGLLDALKGLLPKSEPFPWDPQSIRPPQFTLRLPEGWHFTEADWRSAKAAGPAGQSVDFIYTAHVKGVPASVEELQRAQPKYLEMQGMLVKHDAGLKAAPSSSVLPNGVLWTEASEVKGAEQRFVVYLMRLQPAKMMQLCVRTSIPVSSGALGAERLETLRGVLRGVEWN